jgi:hypothetical protein
MGQRLWVCQVGSGPAYLISGDVGAIDSCVSSFAVMDDTGIDKSAIERLPLLGDGALAATSFWNNAAGGAHAVLSVLNGLGVRAIWAFANTEGDIAFAISGIMDAYPPARAQTAALTAKPSIKGNIGDFPDWGYLMGVGTDASGTNNHTAVDFGLVGPGLSITGISVANPTHVTITAHGLVTGDSINVSGNTNTTPLINGDWPVTFVDANTISIPVNVTVSTGNNGTATKSSQDYGAILVAELLSIGSGTNFTVALQHSADNGVSDAYVTLTGGTSAALTAAAAESRVRTSHTLPVKRWLRVQTAGTYTAANFVAVAKRIAGVE